MNNKQFMYKVQQTSELFSEVVVACKSLLHSSVASDARTYLDTRVSVFNQKKFDFGYFPDEENLDLLISKVGEKTLKKLNLIYNYNIHNKKGLLNLHNIIMPIKDDYGNIVALVGRTLLPESEQKILEISKYKYSSFTKAANLFNLNIAKRSIRHSRSVILVEGQIDCISCHAHGFHNVVALGGASLGWFQFYLLRKYGGKNLTIYLLLDNDNAGRKAQQKIIDRYSAEAIIKKIDLPDDFKDVDQYLHKSNDYSALSDSMSLGE